ncbi:MAG: hypothetical protein HPY62_10015 [Bacteroidales bacterium]|nr:hypothetical protein [Bacteroidales bacterium]
MAELSDQAGKFLSSNFYWLSSDGDEKADFTGLADLPQTNIRINVSPVQQKDGKSRITLTIENTGQSLAFGLNPKILRLTTKEPVLPVYWDDNYFSLIPGEKRVINVDSDTKNLKGDKVLLKIEGWNIKPSETEVK